MTKKMSKRGVENIIDRLMYESIIERGGDDVDKAYKIVANAFKVIIVKKPVIKQVKEISIRQAHINRHKELHSYLDELLADFIRHTGKMPLKLPIQELMEWSNEQTKNPTEINNASTEVMNLEKLNEARARLESKNQF